MKYNLNLFLIFSPVFSAESENNEGAGEATRSETLLHRQRELEADQRILLAAVKHSKYVIAQTPLNMRND